MSTASVVRRGPKSRCRQEQLPSSYTVYELQLPAGLAVWRPAGSIHSTKFELPAEQAPAWHAVVTMLIVCVS
jgi:hypothetical protein